MLSASNIIKLFIEVKESTRQGNGTNQFDQIKHTRMIGDKKIACSIIHPLQHRHHHW
jgi:hypothetical protein